MIFYNIDSTVVLLRVSENQKTRQQLFFVSSKSSISYDESTLRIQYLIGLATKWLRILSMPPNDKHSNHLVANLIFKK